MIRHAVVLEPARYRRTDLDRGVDQVIVFTLASTPDEMKTVLDMIAENAVVPARSM